MCGLNRRVRDGLPQLPDPNKKFGKDRKGVQRFRCNGCRKTFSELQDRPLGTMRLPIEKALQVLQLLVEGVSIRSAERITGVEKEYDYLAT